MQNREGINLRVWNYYAMTYQLIRIQKFLKNCDLSQKKKY